MKGRAGASRPALDRSQKRESGVSSRNLYIILALTILIWGNSFVVVEVAIDDGASPSLIALARFTFASSIFGGYLIWKRPKGIDRADMRKFLALAFIGVGVYYIFQYYGVKFAGPSISSILVTLLCPIMIFLMSHYRLGERMNSEQKTGLLVSAAGSYLVITDGSLSFMESVLRRPPIHWGRKQVARPSATSDP